MKKLFPVLLLFVLVGSGSYCQTLPGLRSPIPRQTYPGFFTVPTKEPLMLMELQETRSSALVVAPEDIVIKKTYQDSAFLSALGEKGKYGLVVAELRSKRPLFRLEHVLDYYKVPAQSRGLKVLVNKQLVDPELLLADITRIARVEVITLDKTSTMRYSWNENEEYLNIVTVN